MSREAVPLHPYALVVVRDGQGRFLLVQERKREQGWYLPAGRVDPGQTFAQAAVRETQEEAGVDVKLTGILHIEETASPASFRLRIFFTGVPVDEKQAPKQHSDEHSLRAAWFTLAELSTLSPLRHEEARAWCEKVAAGAPVAPMSLMP